MAAAQRPKVSVYIAMSLDGYIAREDGSLDWLQPMHVADEDYGYREFFASVDVLVMGRKTYEQVLGFGNWPYAGKRVIVLSHQLKAPQKNVELFSGDVSALVQQLHAEGVRHIYADGGVTICQFLQAQLVDQMILSVVPVFLGSGVPLFSAVRTQTVCRLVSVKSYPTGLAQLHYVF